jgi:MoxR-like ATPase
MILAAQALALVRGREYALPEDVYAIAPDVLRHRLVLSYEALGDNVTTEHVVRAILANIPLPEVVLRERSTIAGAAGTAGAAGDWKWAPPPR